MSAADRLRHAPAGALAGSHLRWVRVSRDDARELKRTATGTARRTLQIVLDAGTPDALITDDARRLILQGEQQP